MFNYVEWRHECNTIARKRKLYLEQLWDDLPEAKQRELMEQTWKYRRSGSTCDHLTVLEASLA